MNKNTVRLTKNRSPKMTDENTNVMIFYDGTALGTTPYNEFLYTLEYVNEKKKANFWTPERLNRMIEQTRELIEIAEERVKSRIESESDSDLIRMFNLNVITLIENGMIPNDNMNGYDFMTKVGIKVRPVHVRPVHIPTVINTQVEVDRTPKNFVPKTIDVLTKAELIVLGTKLGLTGLTKKNVTELKKACMTRRTNQHFQTYIDEILCKIE